MMVVINLMALLLPINEKTTAQVANEYPHLFAPAGITFSIWIIIYLSMLAFVIYQLWLAFSDQHPNELSQVMRQMKGWFMVSSIANACWLFTWHYYLIPVSVAMMLVLLISLLAIHYNFGIGVRPAPLAEKIFIHLPFSIYLGWIAITTIANITILIVYAGWGSSLYSQIGWTNIMIGFATLLSIAMILLRNNIVYALVNVWAFYGILLKRRIADVPGENSIIPTCVIAIGIIAITISWQLYRKQKS
ncbi:hypothetical protein [Chitinophaga sp. 30R24]|uniref:hypothetical protein n=1 Tax=Chitinophaga sp. 30R24 TaxID=3248838 RepID=UPI003B981738